jgi:hypothetical protein
MLFDPKEKMGALFRNALLIDCKKKNIFYLAARIFGSEISQGLEKFKKN